MLLTFLFFALWVCLKADPAQDHAFLVQGVSTIGISGSPCPLLMFGPTVVPLVLDASGRPYGLAGRSNSNLGRVCAFGHSSWKSPSSSMGTASVLVDNCLKWIVGSTPNPTVWGDYSAAFSNAGINRTAIPDIWAPGALNSSTTLISMSIEDLSDGVVIGSPEYFARVETLRTYFEAGGGLYLSGLGWYWTNYVISDMTLHPGNLLLSSIGIAWTANYISSPASVAPYSQALNPYYTSLNFTNASVEDKVTIASNLQSTFSQLLSYGITIPDLTPYQQGVDFCLAQNISWIPTEANPLTKTGNALDRACIQYLHAVRPVIPEPLDVIAGATVFPGIPNGTKTSRNVTKTVSPGRRGWYSTGFYAWPGASIIITRPQFLTNISMGVRIGCHTDSLWSLDWDRWPAISASAGFGYNKRSTTVRNPFGGLIYIDFQVDYPPTGQFDFGFSGEFVDALHWKKGVSTPNDWTNQLANYKAPWAELESDHIVVTVQSPLLAALTPAQLDVMTDFWDKVALRTADLATTGVKTRKERYVFDVQISIGWLHSGYPIMAHLPSQSQSLNDTVDDHWGFFHEIGHNNQNGDWTFSGTGEVTVNLFTIYTTEIFPASNQYVEWGDRNFSIGGSFWQKKVNYIANGASFSDWQSDPFLALYMYIDLQRDFGWECYKQIFRAYNNFNSTQRPSSDADKRDVWMKTFSDNVQKNLCPFFNYWGIPVTQAACDYCSKYPDWSPGDCPCNAVSCDCGCGAQRTSPPNTAGTTGNTGLTGTDATGNGNGNGNQNDLATASGLATSLLFLALQ